MLRPLADEAALGETLVGLARGEPPAADLDRFAGETLADQVELVERTVMQRDGAAALAMGDLDPDPEQIAELPLERGKVGVHRPQGVAGRRSADVAPGHGRTFLARCSACRTERSPSTISLAKLRDLVQWRSPARGPY